MQDQDFPTVVRGPTRNNGYYDHVRYMERREPSQMPHTIEIDKDTGDIVPDAFRGYDGAQEYTSGEDRARGLRIRIIPLFLLLLTLTVGCGVLIVILTDISAIVVVVTGTLICAGMGLIAYNRESLRDYDYSRAGLERHRIDIAAELKEQELDYQFRLKRMLLQHHLQMLETIDRDDQTD